MTLRSSTLRLATIGLASAAVFLLLNRHSSAESHSPNQQNSPISDDDRIDEAIDESFPASDPPSYNAGVDRH